MLSSVLDVSKIWVVVVLLLLVSSSAWGQASVNENLETAFIYVDAQTGSDSNPGTKGRPLKTIGAAATVAVNNNHNGIGSRVIINPGTYRESISVGNGSRSTSLPMTFQAATNGTAIVSGADVWKGWIPYSLNSKIYTQSWPYQWGLCAGGGASAPTEQDITLRKEMIVVNGKPLTEVLSLTAMQPGTFFPDEARSTVYIWPPAGTNMSTATVEVATRSSLFTDAGQPNLVLRGLTFQYANSCHQNPAVNIIGAKNVLIDSGKFVWNNAIGLTLVGSQDFTVQSATANHNGQMGFNTYQVKHGLWQSDTASYNNWRGAQGAYYSFDTGGGKFMKDHNSTFQNFTALFNQTHGMHFDTDNAYFAITSLLAVGNADSFLIEKSEGPATISSSYFCGNTPFGQAYQGGITILDSTSLTYTGNTLYGNGSNQINFTGSAGGFSVTNWETGQVYQLVTQNLTLQNNTVVGSSTAQLFSDSYLGGSDWNQLISTLSSDNNTWWAGTNTSAFTVPSPKSSNVTLKGWQSLTGQDMHSKWASAASPAACNVQTEGPDYLLLTRSIRPVTVSSAGQATFSISTVPLGGMTGTVNLSLDGISAIPGASAGFSPPSISPSGTSVLTLVTGPHTPAGTYPVTIVGNSGNVTHTITVSVAVPATSVRLSTTSLTFPAQKIGTTSGPQTITLTNTGSLPLAISGISSSGIFAQTNNCGLVVNAGKSCAISVAFSPHSLGAAATRMTIKDVDPTSPQGISLSGTGLAAPDVELSPTFLGFGLHKVGTTATKTVTLTNQGTAALTITNLSVTGVNGKDFSQTNNCGSSLPAGKSCTVNVSFKPSTKGTRTAVLSVYDDDVDSMSPQTVNLNGGGS